MQVLHTLAQRLHLNMDFENSAEFERKYTAISLQRGRLFKIVTFFVGLYSLYLDLILEQDNSVDLLFRKTLVAIHLVILVLSAAYVILYSLLRNSRRYQFSRVAKAAILFDMGMSLLIAASLCVNGQRYTGNLDAYIMVVFTIALIIPLYPKWVIGIYAGAHALFVIALSLFHHSSSITIKQFNSTIVVAVAIILFMVLYQYNVKNFLSEERLKKDKANFIKLFEINPFPLMISNFADGKIRYVNQRAVSFYEVRPEQLDGLNHTDFYETPQDLTVIRKTLEANGSVSNYAVVQKTASGKTKRSIVNYELIDYFGEKAVLIGVVDISVIKRIEHELTVHASVDILTGVLNRRVGMELLRNRFEMAKRLNTGFILCFIDIDDLKAANDTYGHLEGDALIAEVCKIIKEATQPSDMIFRYGGDEFVVLFGDNNQREAEEACRRIDERFEVLNKSGYKPYSISASIGRFVYAAEMDLGLEQIIEIVDRNMYSSKLTKKRS